MQSRRVHGLTERLAAARTAVHETGGVLLTGPPRVGLSTAVDTLLAQAAAGTPPPVVLRAGARRGGRGGLRAVAYRAVCGGGTGSPVADTLAAARHQLGTDLGADPVPVLGQTCAALLRHAPVLLAVEDLHHLAAPRARPGAATQVAAEVAALVAAVLDTGATVVLTAQLDPLCCAAALAAMVRQCLRPVELGALAEQDIARIVRDRLAAAPEDRLVAEVARLSGGRAGVAHDIAGVLGATAVAVVDGHAVLRTGRVPDEVLALPADHSLVRQLDSLPGRGRAAVLRWAARPGPGTGAALPAELWAAQVLSGPAVRPRCTVPVLAAALGNQLGPVAASRLNPEPVADAPDDAWVDLAGTLHHAIAAPDVPAAITALGALATRVGRSAAGVPAERAVRELTDDAAGARTWIELADAVGRARERLEPAERTDLDLLGWQVGATLRGRGLVAAQSVLTQAGAEVPQPLAHLAEAVLLTHAGHGEAAAAQLRSVVDDDSDPTGPPDAVLGAARQVHTAISTAQVLAEPSSAAAPDEAGVLHAFVQGRWDEALSAARQLETALPHRIGAVPAVHRCCAAEIHRLRGRVDAAQRWLLQRHGLPVLAHLHQWAQAGLDATLGDRATALAQARRAVAEAEAEGATSTRVLLLGRLARLQHAAGSPAAARTVGLLAAELDGDGSDGSDSAVDTGGSRWEHLHTRAVVHRDADAATRAVALASSLGLPLALARSCVVAADLGHSPESHLHQALRLLTELGATHARALVAARLRRLGHRVPVGPRDARGRTPNDLLAAELIAAGHPNSTIARLLAVGDKQVEALVRAEFRRTGVHSRVDHAQHFLADHER